MRILIIGNVVKDVYLNLDEKQNKFETDEKGTPWLDLGFNETNHSYFSRTSVFGGAAVTLDIFKKFGLNASISGYDDDKIIKTYRYILSANDHISYFTPTERTETKFTAPNEPVDWIFVDRSAEVTEALVKDIKNYLWLSSRTKLVVFVSAEDNFETRSATMKLTKLANIVFTDSEIEFKDTDAVVCRILENEIRCGDFIRRYRMQKTALMTHLTVYSIIASTIFGAILRGMSTLDAINIAIINVENSKITGSPSLSNLMKKLEERKNSDENLRLLTKTILVPGKGILAADESGGSIHKKFVEAGIPDDAKHRRDYRNLFFTTQGIEKFISGIILFDETARQKSDDGRDFVSYLTSLGIVPGIKVDQGLEPFADPKYSKENYTKGLEGLPERLIEYYDMGARFAKWRAAFDVKVANVGSGKAVKIKTPSDYAIKKNCEILAQYARDCQNAGIVPIVEPEVVYDSYYSIETSAEITGKVLDMLFEELKHYDVNIEGCILKTSMVLAGKKYEKQSTPEEVGEYTAKVLKEHCPKELAGIVFLSGGQSVEQATANLQAVTNNGPFPWIVTFSFARALQAPTLEAWKGDNNNAKDAKDAFYNRLVANCQALNKNDLS